MSRVMDKPSIVAILEEMALLLEVSGANPFEIRAYRNGAASLADWPGDVADAVAHGTLTDIHGIGKGLARVITDLVREGRSADHERLRAPFPPGFLELFRISGLGVKKVMALHRELGVGDLDALERAAREGRIRDLRGFGARSEERILAGIERRRRRRAEAPTGDRT
jgi:DNA polymerase (family 10)